MPVHLHICMPGLLRTLNAWMIVNLSACATTHLHICPPAKCIPSCLQVAYTSTYVLYMCTPGSLHTCVSIYSCTWIPEHLQAFIYICTPLCQYTFTDTHLSICISLCLHSWTPAQLSTWVQDHTPALTLCNRHLCAYSSVCLHIYVPKHLHTCIPIYLNTSSCVLGISRQLFIPHCVWFFLGSSFPEYFPLYNP